MQSKARQSSLCVVFPEEQLCFACKSKGMGCIRDQCLLWNAFVKDIVKLIFYIKFKNVLSKSLNTNNGNWLSCIKGHTEVFREGTLNIVFA